MAALMSAQIMATIAGFGAIKRSLKNRNYRIFATGSVLSNIGTWVQRVAIGWLAWELTQSGFWLGVVAFSDLFPIVLLAPFAGALTDRADQMVMLKIAQACQMLQATLLAVFTVTGLITIHTLVLFTFLGGVVVSLNQPARLTVVPLLVGREDLSAAIGLNSFIFNVARFIGPAIAGIAIAAEGVWLAMAINAFSFGWMLFSLTRIHISDTGPAVERRPFGELPSEIAGGFRYIMTHPGIGPLLLLQFVVSTCARPYMELFPGFAADVFGRGAQGLAWLTSMTGIGAAVGGFWLAGRGRLGGLTAISVLSAIVFALSIIGFAATDSYYFALACTCVAGWAMVSIGVAQQTLIQAAVDASMRGRVIALYGMVVRGAPAIGALAMGAASHYVGMQLPVLIGGGLTVLAWLWAVRRERRIAEFVEKE